MEPLLIFQYPPPPPKEKPLKPGGPAAHLLTDSQRSSFSGGIARETTWPCFPNPQQFPEMTSTQFRHSKATPLLVAALTPTTVRAKMGGTGLLASPRSGTLPAARCGRSWRWSARRRAATQSSSLGLRLFLDFRAALACATRAAGRWKH